MEIEREGELGAISMGHSQYIKDLLHAHGIENCRQAATPLNAGYQDTTLCQSAVGELMWLATRPDILHSVSKLAHGIRIHIPNIWPVSSMY